MELLGVPEGQPFFKTFDADGGEVAVQVKCNVTVSDVIVPDSCAWMTVKEQKQEGDILNITFTVAPSDHVRARYASAYFYTNADISARVPSLPSSRIAVTTSKYLLRQV